MNWKEQLHDLEQAKDWDAAIAFMEKFIQEQPDNMEAYLFINYLLANLITEEQDWDLHNEDTWNHVVDLLKKYLEESYGKFSNNPEYLFYTAKICGYVD